MDISLLSSSSIKLSDLCPLQRITSSFPFQVKNIATPQLLSARLSKHSQISPSTKLRCPVFSCSDFRPNGCINKLTAIGTQDAGQAEPDRSNTLLEKISHFSDVLWRFMRPYVICGTTVGYTAILARTWMEHSHPLGWSHLVKALGGLIALLCVDGYANGINGIFDVEIDRINKPHLPVASGELSITLAWLLVIMFAAIGVIIAGVLKFGPFASFICGLYFLGTIYSVPPFSMKRSTVGAIIVIALLRGCVLILAASSAAAASLRLPFALRAPIIFISIFTTVFASSIAVLKDLSDVEGDRKFNVPTLATTIGVRNIAFIGCGLLTLNYLGAISASIFMPQIFKRNIMIPAHTLLALCLIFLTWKLDRVNYEKDQSQVFYQFIWKLMFVEYALFPFI